MNTGHTPHTAGGLGGHRLGGASTPARGAAEYDFEHEYEEWGSWAAQQRLPSRELGSDARSAVAAGAQWPAEVTQVIDQQFSGIPREEIERANASLAETDRTLAPWVSDADSHYVITIEWCRTTRALDALLSAGRDGGALVCLTLLFNPYAQRRVYQGELDGGRVAWLECLRDRFHLSLDTTRLRLALKPAGAATDPA